MHQLLSLLSLFFPFHSSFVPSSLGATDSYLPLVHLASLVHSPLPFYPKWNSHRYASLCFALINSDTHTMNNERGTDDREKGRGRGIKEIQCFWSITIEYNKKNVPLLFTESQCFLNKADTIL